MTPMWIWSLGRYFMKENPHVTIPTASVFISLAVTMIPVALGALLGYFKPRIAYRVTWCLKPFTVLMGIIFIGGGIYVYWFALIRISWRVVLACILIPIVGYIAGYTAAMLFKQKQPRAISISLEIGFQNFSLATLMLSTSLQHPELEFAGVVPILYSLCSAVLPVVFYWTLSGYMFYEKYRGSTCNEDDVIESGKGLMDNPADAEVECGTNSEGERSNRY